MTTFTVDLSAPAGSKVIDPAGFEAYLRDSIKVAGKKANLGESVGVSRKGATVSVAAKIPFSKRYVKYLTKRYLKKESTREYLRVVADGKLGYTVKFLVLGGDKEEES